VESGVFPRDPHFAERAEPVDFQQGYACHPPTLACRRATGIKRDPPEHSIHELSGLQS